EIGPRAEAIKDTLATEENSFNKTLDRGLQLFESDAGKSNVFPTEDAFKLYDTYGFPLDLTALLCRERGIALDEAAVEDRMEQARELSRASQKKTIVRALDLSSEANTEFLGFDADSCEAKILEVHQQDEQILVITDKTVLFTEMGGQEGDVGTATIDGVTYPIVAVQKIGHATAHTLENLQHSTFNAQQSITIELDRTRRLPIEAHHTATHLLHWALHEVVSTDASQQGSSVSPDRLRFDFNAKALTPAQITEMEDKVNTCIQKAATVSWIEVPHTDVKKRADIMQFFGDKYGDLVRVVQIGGESKALNGYSMELCGGTHVRNTSEIGFFKIKSEGAIASGVRRIEALCGQAAWNWLNEIAEKGTAEEKVLRDKLNQSNHALSEAEQSPVEHVEFPHIMAALLTGGNDPHQINATVISYQKHLSTLREACIDADKKVKKVQAAGAAKMANAMLEEQDLATNLVIHAEGPAALLQELMNGLKQQHFANAAFCIVDDGAKLHLGALCGDDAKAAGLMAGKLIQTLAPIVGGKGGGKPDMARGAAPNRAKVSELEAEAKKVLSV
ncbi:MAG: alanyl-tRNA synthetase, partial [Lentimonas sp.]